jgi:hypothetical protein
MNTTNNMQKWDDALRMTSDRDTEAYPIREAHYQRGDGKTFRSVMWSLMMTSNNPDKVGVHLSLTRSHSEHAFRMAAFAVNSLAGVRIDHTSHTIVLPNNGKLVFRTVNDDPVHTVKGHRVSNVVKDY